MASDLFSTLRVYLSKFSEGERNPSEVVAALNTWLRDSGESIKIKIEEEVERSVKKMGFVKQSDFDRLSQEVESLKKALQPSKKETGKVSAPRTSKTRAKSASKKAPAKKTAAKKSVVKKASAKKTTLAKGGK